MTNVQTDYVNMNIPYTTNKQINDLCNICMLIVLTGIEPKFVECWVSIEFISCLLELIEADNTVI